MGTRRSIATPCQVMSNAAVFPHPESNRDAESASSHVLCLYVLMGSQGSLVSYGISLGCAICFRFDFFQKIDAVNELQADDLMKQPSRAPRKANENSRHSGSSTASKTWTEVEILAFLHVEQKMRFPILRRTASSNAFIFFHGPRSAIPKPPRPAEGLEQKQKH